LGDWEPRLKKRGLAPLIRLSWPLLSSGETQSRLNRLFNIPIKLCDKIVEINEEGPSREIQKNPPLLLVEKNNTEKK